MTSILVVDAEAVAAAGLQSYFSESAAHGFVALKEVAGTIAGAKRLMETLRPNFILVDFRLGQDHVGGIRVAEFARQALPDSHVVFFSNREEPIGIAMALGAGAAAYVSKRSSLSELQAVLTSVCISPPSATMPKADLLHVVREDLARRDLIPVAGLTARESQIARCVGYGLSNRQIAKVLHISVETVKEHIQNVLQKLSSAGVKALDRTMIAVFVVKNRFVLAELYG